MLEAVSVLEASGQEQAPVHRQAGSMPVLAQALEGLVARGPGLRSTTVASPLEPVSEVPTRASAGMREFSRAGPRQACREVSAFRARRTPSARPISEDLARAWEAVVCPKVSQRAGPDP